ncbi:G-type lectin S-receptor-like serine/threonine-protein kinase [Capsicum annuum]|uniref:G-type lectin S-receptor-like serine/threonine-protein kinase At4g27290 isoform X2 n=2 Tax=Capsicum annuum TaxID=4072 RepID=UPI0007BFBCF0|nr:G-type lectin S-receptor-like serine/threonine-protein kinase At4g27290 isoform X2 [Capsicum annuum]KAF3654933.1 G-type lectin S-receptor-like serine/threonine-protein kinase [Capsicum annuum]
MLRLQGLNFVNQKSRLFFLIICSQFLFMLLTSAALDTITTDKSIRDGDTIVSAGGVYELGFFSPGNSKNRYVGIWYKKIAPRTVVWVANRDIPLNDTSGVLTLKPNGILVLVDGSNVSIWSSNSSRSLKNPKARLLDSANLVISDGNDRDQGINFAWQSFDYLGDTLLPGMKIGKDLVTGLDRYVTSWKSTDDPAPGEYVDLVDSHGYPQMLLFRNSSIVFSSGPWNGLAFTSSPSNKPTLYYTFEYVINQQEIFYKYELKNDSMPTRVVLKPDGVIEQLIWIEKSHSWLLYLTAQLDNCDRFALCGPYAICNINNSPPCDCLRGFEPRYPQDSTADWSTGCVRRTTLECNQDGFLEFSGIKIPDSRNSWYNETMNLEDCKKMCLADCNCTAYSDLDVRNGGSGCLLWFGELIDIREFSQNDQNLYVRVAASELDKTRRRKRLALIVVMSAVVATFILSFLAWFSIKRRKRRRGSEIQNDDIELPLFDLVTVTSATENFSSANVIGEGGFGPVYKGILPSGQEIAVKRLSKYSGQGIQELKNEIVLISKLQHRNLVKLLGCCLEGEERMLIYEFMPNASLDYFIFDPSRKAPLAWKNRFEITMGISRGLLYLHQDSRLRIIHRDLKTNNILLDSDMNAKISDFGLAKVFGADQVEGKTKRVIGTYGYMSPEYAVDGKYSVKSDVFSIGVIILEIVSGKRNRKFRHLDHHHNLLGHAWLLWTEGKALELMDECLKEPFSESQVLRCIQVGLLCVQKLPEDRPTMASVVFWLGNEGLFLPQPKQPGFFIERNSMESTESTDKVCVSNSASITVLEPR